MRILLVEPEVRERGELSHALTLEDYSVRPTRDSREAVRLFLAEPVDLLLVCQREPALDGVVAFELLTAIKPSLPVIVVTPPPPIVALHAAQDGPITLDTGRRGRVRDALTGERVGSGPRVTVPMKKGDTRVLRY